ncbi:MAG: pyridoxine 5'-phosphate synthase [Phycisphaeraceae bacterium]
MATKLSVNVNKVALLRNSRSGEVPSPLQAATIALQAGAAGVTVHPRPDERHIRPYDVDHLAELLLEDRWADREFNIEGNPFEGRYMELVERVRPDQCTLVPDTPGQSTSDHGWDIARDGDRLAPVVARLQALGCRVSLFMDPDPATIARAAQTGADRVELYTESYAVAQAAGGSEADRVFEQFEASARHASEAGLGVNGGHDLNLENLGRFVTIPGILEVSIGHALVADALWMGLADTVKAYREVIARARSAD